LVSVNELFVSHRRAGGAAEVNDFKALEASLAASFDVAFAILEQCRIIDSQADKTPRRWSGR
jgi:hypothetical protein